MAKKRAGDKVNATKPEPAVRGVRLDLQPDDHERLERIARRNGLSMAAYCRMAVLQRLAADDAQTPGK